MPAGDTGEWIVVAFDNFATTPGTLGESRFDAPRIHRNQLFRCRKPGAAASLHWPVDEDCPSQAALSAATVACLRDRLVRE
jgi:hypothetical protein